MEERKEKDDSSALPSTRRDDLREEEVDPSREEGDRGEADQQQASIDYEFLLLRVCWQGLLASAELRMAQRQRAMRADVHAAVATLSRVFGSWQLLVERLKRTKAVYVRGRPHWFRERTLQVWALRALRRATLLDGERTIISSPPPPPWSLRQQQHQRQQHPWRRRDHYEELSLQHWRRQVQIKVLIDLTRHVFHGFEGRRKHALASDHSATTALYGAWAGWREAVLGATASSHYTKVIAFHFFKAWRHSALLGKQARLKLRQASSHRHRALLMCTLNGWWWNVYRRQSKRRRYAEARRHRMEFLCAACFSRWRRWTESVVKEEDKERMAVRHRYREQLRVGMRAFFGELTQARGALAMWDAAGQHYRWYAARKALGSWRYVNASGIEAAMHRNAFVARSVLNQLRGAPAARIRREEGDRTARAHWARGLVCAAMGSWMDFRDERRVEKHEEVARSNILQSRLLALKLSRVFAAWDAQRMTGGRKKKAFLLAWMMLTRRAMQGWKALVAESNARRKVLNSVHHYSCERATVRVFLALEQCVAANRNVRERNVRALRFWSLGVLRRTWASWSAQLLVRHENKCLMQQALDAHHLRLVRRGLSQWAAFVSPRHSAALGVVSAMRVAVPTDSLLIAADSFARMEHEKHSRPRPSADDRVSIPDGGLDGPQRNLGVLPGESSQELTDWVNDLVPKLRGASDFVQPRVPHWDHFGSMSLCAMSDPGGPPRDAHLKKARRPLAPTETLRDCGDIIVGRRTKESPLSGADFGDAVLEGEWRLRKVILEGHGAPSGDKSENVDAPSKRDFRGESEIEARERIVPPLNLAAVR